MEARLEEKMNTELLPTDQLQTFFTCLSNQFPSNGSMYRENEALSFLPLASPGFDSDTSSVHSPNSPGYSDDGHTHTVVPKIFSMENPCDVINESPSTAPLKLSHTTRKNLVVDSQKQSASLSLPPESIEELLEEADLKRKRLARKAELARVSRKRKKQRIEELEDEVADLKRQLEHERKRAKTTHEAQLKREVLQPAPSPGSIALQTEEQLTASIAAMIKGSSDEPAPALLRGFYEAFKQKVKMNTTHLDLLSKGSRPCLPLRFVQWLMSQSDKFYSDPNGLWTSLLAQEVGATPEQLAMLGDLRGELQRSSPAPAWAEVEAAASHFDKLLRSHMSASTQSLERFMGILSPAQLVSFFKWVDRFGGVCVKINL